MTTCEFCDGEGWIYAFDESGDETLHASPCPQCHGSGWIEGEAPLQTLEDLDLRAPIESLLKWWSCLATRDAWPEQRARIAAECDRRITWKYRVSEC